MYKCSLVDYQGLAKCKVCTKTDRLCTKSKKYMKRYMNPLDLNQRDPNDYPRIIQIIPATVPAWAVFDANTPDEVFDPVIMWALMEDVIGQRYTDGLTAADVIKGEPYTTSDSSNFSYFTTKLKTEL